MIADTVEIKPGMGFPVQESGNKKYFVIKAQNIKAIDNSVAKDFWIFAPTTEKKINRALKVKLST